MITQRAVDYAKVLFSLELNEESIKRAKQIFLENLELIQTFENPMISIQEKEAVIQAIFDKEICGFLVKLCENQCMEIVHDIFTAHESIVLESKNILEAKLTYAVQPEDAEIEQIKGMLCDKFNKTGVSLALQEDASLIGGYVLSIGNTEYDKSIKGTLLELQKTLVGR